MQTRAFSVTIIRCFRCVWKSLVLITVLLLLNSCQPSSLTRIYAEPSFLPGPIKKILIIGVMEKEEVRKTFEASLARKFIAEGVDALPAYKILPSIKGLDRKTVSSKIEGMAFDSVLITWPIRIGQEKVIIPLPEVNHDNFLDDFFTRYHSVVGSNYQLDLEWLYLENRLYETVGGRLAWSSHTKEFDINSNEIKSTIDLLARMIISDLARKGIIADS